MPTKTHSDESSPSVRPCIPAEDTCTSVTREKERVASKMFSAIDTWESAAHRWLMRYSITALRISLGAVLFGFGVLKYFPGVSPAEDLARETTHLLSFGLIPAVVPSGVAMALLATLECTIGVLLLSGRWLRLAICLLVVQLAGILSPVVLLPGRIFAGPHHMPTLEGQYVLKNVILLAAAMVIAATIRGAALNEGGSQVPKNTQAPKKT